MKYIFLLGVLLFRVMTNVAQEGVNFEHLSFLEALNKAQTENKLVFVDCYTSWCGPCRNMTERIFPQKKVGEYFNSKFVCVKYDMEKGEGPELAKRFGVRAYPTFLVLRADGTLIHRFVGGRDADGIVRSVEEAFNVSKASGALEESYQLGRRDKDFLLNYLESLVGLYDPRMNVVAEELMEQLSDKERISEKYWFLFTNPKLSPESSVIERYLLKNYTRFCKSIGEDNVAKEVEKRYIARFMRIFRKEEMITKRELKVLGHEIASLKLASNNDFQSYVRIVQGELKGIADLVDVCEREFLNITTLEAPYLQFYDRVMKEGTPKDGKRWIALGEKLYNMMKDEKKKWFIKLGLDMYKK